MFLAIIIIIYQYNESIKNKLDKRKDFEAFRQQAKKCFYKN
tara:strand:- start:796 stop:918 length:123 start_codon:yes stop_codon:yes gene_type:complete